MLFNVPQFINIEDKIVGPLTAKQLGWLGAGGLILLITWNIFDTQAFFVSAVISAAVFGALAFYRPYGQPLINVIFSSITFFFPPKIYVWKRIYANISMKKPLHPKVSAIIEKKKIDQRKVSEISKMLDLK